MTDLRRALRRLIRTPAFSLVGISTLALGIGANTAIFSVVNAALIRPLPYPTASKIVRIFAPSLGGPGSVSPPDFVDWRLGTTAFSAMTAVNSASSALTHAGTTVEIDGAVVTGDFFEVMGVRPALGRALDSTDAQSTANHTLVLSDSIWRRVFGADAGILGRSIRLDEVPYTVVGVMPRDFDYPSGSGFWTPLVFTAQELTTQRGAHYLDVIGRLRPGVSLGQARAEMRTIWAGLARDHPTQDVATGGEVVTLRTSLTGDARQALLILLAAVGLVLIIACTNVANLLLVRALHRHREMTIRVALGAPHARLIVESLTEALLLASAGGAVGFGLSVAGLRLTAALRPDDVTLATATVDWRVLLAGLMLSLATGLVFGLMFAYQAVPRGSIGPGPAIGPRSTAASPANRRAKRALAVIEIVFAVVLVSSAGLLLRSFLALRAVDPGYRSDNRIAFDIALPDAQYNSPEKCALFFRDFLARLRAIPGVQDVVASTGIPMSAFSYSITTRTLDGRLLAPEEQDRLSMQVRRVSERYLGTMGIPIRLGRGLTDEDRGERPPVVVVNEAAARLLFPGGNPVGHTITIGTTFEPGRPRAGGEIVGVAGDVREFGLGRPPVPEMYVTIDQFPPDFGTIVVQSTQDPRVVIAAARTILAEIAPDVAVFHATTLDALESASIGRPRFMVTLVGLFAGVAITMSIIGLYGVIAFGVGERSKEIGIRVAMGARPGDVTRLVVSEGLRLGAIGVVVGLALSLGTGHALQGLLYGVRPVDVPTVAVTGVTMLIAAIFAAWLPARRAARLDPVAAIRIQ